MSRPTMETVAERAGVSRALVSLVMNNSSKVSEAKRQAVLNAAEQLGYRPNLHARNLAQARTKTLGMIINDIHNPFFAEVVYGVEAAADDYGTGSEYDDSAWRSGKSDVHRGEMLPRIPKSASHQRHFRSTFVFGGRRRRIASPRRGNGERIFA